MAYTEKRLEQIFCGKVKQKGGMAFKFVSPGMSGVPDRLVLLPEGKVAFAELKAPGKKLSPKQTKVAKQMEGLGHPVWVIDGIDAIQAFLWEAFDG